MVEWWVICSGQDAKFSFKQRWLGEYMHAIWYLQHSKPIKEKYQVKYLRLQQGNEELQDNTIPVLNKPSSRNNSPYI